MGIVFLEFALCLPKMKDRKKEIKKGSEREGGREGGRLCPIKGYVFHQ